MIYWISIKNLYLLQIFMYENFLLSFYNIHLGNIVTYDIKISSSNKEKQEKSFTLIAYFQFEKFPLPMLRYLQKILRGFLHKTPRFLFPFRCFIFIKLTYIRNNLILISCFR